MGQQRERTALVIDDSQRPLFDFEVHAPTQAPEIERIWRTRSPHPGTFTSLATTMWQLVFWRGDGRWRATVRGPETAASLSPTPADAEFFGVFFTLGTVLPSVPARSMVDSAVTLPSVAPDMFLLGGVAWRFPTFENVDVFVDRLRRDGVLVEGDVRTSSRLGEQKFQSLRSVQRHFRRTTGLTRTEVRQIERARNAAVRLREGMSIADTIDTLGYFDQPHLTRSLTRFIGRTPAQLSDPASSTQLSLLYKTNRML